MARPVGALASLLLAAVFVAGCGASQPSSDVSVLTPAPGSSASAAASDVPSPKPDPLRRRRQLRHRPARRRRSRPSRRRPSPGTRRSSASARCPAPAQGTFADTFKITWTEPDGVADSFLVYGLPDCLRDQKKFDGKPCVVKGMKIPADKLTLLGVAPGDQRSHDDRVGRAARSRRPPYSTVLIRAKNAKGPSIFTIVHSDDVCFGCTY